MKRLKREEKLMYVAAKKSFHCSSTNCKHFTQVQRTSQVVTIIIVVTEHNDTINVDK